MLRKFLENNEVFALIIMLMLFLGGLFISYKKSKLTDEEYIKQLTRIELGFNNKPDLKALRRRDKRGIVMCIGLILLVIYFILDKILK